VLSAAFYQNINIMDILDQFRVIATYWAKDVVDAFIKVEKINQIKSEIRNKQNQIKYKLENNELPTKCGSCSFWMTSDCPKEKHTKVSNGMPICNSFKKAFWIDKTIQKLETEIHELQFSLNGLVTMNDNK
jgi:hypothetical protein